MKKALLISLIVLLGLAGSALAAPKYGFMPFYQIVGQVSAITEAPVEGRTIVFFKTLATGGLVTTYTSATLDATGKFKLNASTNLGLLPLKVGETCQVAVVRDAKGYGAGPVSFRLSGIGYDSAPAMAMAFGAGVGIPGVSSFAEPPPRIQYKFGNRLYQISRDPAGNPLPFVVSANTTVSLIIEMTQEGYTLASTVNKDMAIDLDGASASKTLTAKADNPRPVTMAGSSDPSQIVAMSLEFKLTEPISREGTHIFTVTASSSGLKGSASSATETAQVEVLGGPVRLIGTPICFPTPFSISKNGTVTIQYQLSKNAEVSIVFADISARLTKTFVFQSGAEGGSAGINKVTWDGRTDRGTLAGNGIYLGTIISKEDGRKLGTVKLTVLD